MEKREKRDRQAKRGLEDGRLITEKKNCIIKQNRVERSDTDDRN